MFESIIRHLRHWRIRNTTRRRLHLLDDRLLADIGTDRQGIGAFAASHTIEGA